MDHSDDGAAADVLGEALRAAWREALADLDAEGRLHPGIQAAPRIPPPFSDMLARALAVTEGEERAGARERAAPRRPGRRTRT